MIYFFLFWAGPPQGDDRISLRDADVQSRSTVRAGPWGQHPNRLHLSDGSPTQPTLWTRYNRPVSLTGQQITFFLLFFFCSAVWLDFVPSPWNIATSSWVDWTTSRPSGDGHLHESSSIRHWTWLISHFDLKLNDHKVSCVNWNLDEC